MRSTSYKTPHFLALLDFIETNTPLPQQPMGPLSRELKKLAYACFGEVSDNLIELSPTEGRLYRDYLLRTLPTLRFYQFEEIAAVWMAVRQFELTEEQAAANNSFVEEMSDKGFTIYLPTEIGEVRHAKMVAVMQLSELFEDWVDDLCEYFDNLYEFSRRARFLGQNKEDYISQELLRDFEALFLEKLSEEGIKELNAASLPGLDLLYARLRVDQRNFYEEYQGNYYRQKADISIPYMEQLQSSLSAARNRWEHILISRTLSEDLVGIEKETKLRGDLRNFVLHHLDQQLSSIAHDLEEQRTWPFMLDIHNPDSLSHDHKIHRELIVYNPEMAVQLSEEPEELMEELEERLGIPIPILEARLPVILDEKRWTQEDGHDNGRMWEYTSREFWETSFKEY